MPVNVHRVGVPSGTSAKLNDVAADPPPDLLFVVVACPIGPSDSPGLNCRVPDSKRRSIHIAGFVWRTAPGGALRHDPHVLHGAPLEHPREMNFASDALRGDVNTPVAADIQLPTSDQPSVCVG